MRAGDFIAVGENIHCTRIYKVGGKFCGQREDGSPAIFYGQGRAERALSVPVCFTQNADWTAGKVKHCQVAIWQGVNGDAAGQAAGRAYLEYLASSQEAAGATYLDINVDEYSTDVEERVRLMEWAVDVVQGAASIPASIDSSNIDILAAGLRACDRQRGRPMVNSVSLERADAIDTAATHNAVVIASAAGEKGLPSTQEERMGNIDRVIGKLRESGLAAADIHIDPLVFPISTDGRNGVNFLETVAAVRAQYGPEIHIVAGLSNISFGMPSRKLINQVFAWLSVEAGADGGIVDPEQINGAILRELDPECEPFRLARALLTGEDDFGMEFISASRSGRV